MNTKNQAEIIIDMFSDIACPWCYIGEKILKTSLQQFLQDNPKFKAIINFHPLIIDPATQKNGEEYLAYNKRRWGGDGWTGELKAKGNTIGCLYKNWKIWPNTLLCHCLIAEGSKIGKQVEIVDDIFELVYEQGENVSDKETLNKIAEKYSITNWDSKEIESEVLKDDAMSKSNYNIKTVPHFRFNNGAVVDNSSDVQTFVKTLETYKH